MTRGRGCTSTMRSHTSWHTGTGHQSHDKSHTHRHLLVLVEEPSHPYHHSTSALRQPVWCALQLEPITNMNVVHDATPSLVHDLQVKLVEPVDSPLAALLTEGFDYEQVTVCLAALLPNAMMPCGHCRSTVRVLDRGCVAWCGCGCGCVCVSFCECRSSLLSHEVFALLHHCRCGSRSGW